MDDAIVPADWFYVHIFDGAHRDSVMVMVCSKECTELEWQAGPGLFYSNMWRKNTTQLNELLKIAIYYGFKDIDVYEMLIPEEKELFSKEDFLLLKDWSSAAKPAVDAAMRIKGVKDEQPEQLKQPKQPKKKSKRRRAP